MDFQASELLLPFSDIFVLIQHNPTPFSLKMQSLLCDVLLLLIRTFTTDYIDRLTTTVQHSSGVPSSITSPSAGESSSALAMGNRLATSPMSADSPSHRSSGSISDFLNTTLPSPSLIRIGALERLVAVKNRSLVEPGREAVRHS
jgi:hypothetical protein